jgi:elongation factor G
LKEFTSDNIRNIALIGHGGAGKTAFAEAVLFSSDATSRLGKIEEGTTISDYNADEIERQISIHASLLHCEWKAKKINIIDTPGYTDFTGEVKCGLRVADVGVLFVKGVEGVEVGTEIVWTYAKEYAAPVVFLVNKLDYEHADFDKAVHSTRERFGSDVTIVQFPLNQGLGFDSVVDVLRMKLLKFAADGSGKYTEEDIPADAKAKADELREQLVEKIAETDENLLNAFFEKGGLSEEEIINGLRAGIKNRKVFPLLCSAATRNVGASAFLDFLVTYCPSPRDWEEVVGVKPNSDQKVTVKPDGEPILFVFKSMSEPHVGELSFFRVYSGTISQGLDLINQTNGKVERLSQIFVMNGKERKEVGKSVAGDIGSLVKLKDTHTNDTLTGRSLSVVLPRIQFPEPVISFAIIPKSKGDEDRISTGLHSIHEEDPTFVVKVDQELNQTIISGQGELHLNIGVKRLKEKYNVDVDVVEPKIPYKETIRGTVPEVEYKHKKQTGGRGQYGHVWIKIEPKPRGTGFEFEDAIVGGVVPGRFIPAVEKGILDAMQKGVIAGYQVVDVKVTLFDGSYHTVDSDEMSFKIAGSMAFKRGFKEAKPILLEPIYDIEVVVPEDYMGDVMGDLSSRRGKISGMDAEGLFQVVKAQIPLAEIHQYATRLRSMTQGRGVYRRRFSHYEEVPREIVEKIIAASEKHKVEEEA